MNQTYRGMPIIGGKCGCPSILCNGNMDVGEPSRRTWQGRQNKRGHVFSRGRRTHRGGGNQGK